MAWNDPGETIVAGTGQVYVAPIGTTLPTNESTNLNSAFVGLGYHTEDGVSVNKSIEVVEQRAWQSKFAIRRDRGNEDFALTFALEQWNETNVPLAFGGGTIVDLTGGHYRYNPPASSDALAEKALICEVNDGADKWRFIVPRGTVTEGVESQFARNVLSALPITFQALEPDDGGLSWYLLTNSADFAAGS